LLPLPVLLPTFHPALRPSLQLDLEAVVACYRRSRRRLLVLGYNATLTTAVEAPRQPKKHFDQIQALTRVNPAAYSCLAALSQNPMVDIVVRAWLAGWLEC
jgi:trehalose 6-phosphate synthase/phosphatase